MKWQVANCYCRDFPIGFLTLLYDVQTHDDSNSNDGIMCWVRFHNWSPTGVLILLDLLPLEILGLGFTLEKHSFGDFFLQMNKVLDCTVYIGTI